MVKNRRETRSVRIGSIYIGSCHDIAVQSMCNTKTENIEATIRQIKELESVNCKMARIAIPTMEAAKAVREIKKEIKIPLIGDIHFNHNLALEAISNGIDKIRINPGNIGGKERTKEVITACKEKNIAVRIGVNSGSIEKDILEKYGVSSRGMILSMSKYISYFEEENFHNLVLSLKASDVRLMIETYKEISKLYNYPLHLGVTEAGSFISGTVKSAVGIGALLSEGIGDTIRVSLTSDVKKEVMIGYEILKSLDLIESYFNIISCPTCGRTSADIEKIVNEVESRLSNLKPNGKIDIAIMGCPVNGPGEASEADIGIACGKNDASLFLKGEIIKKIPLTDATDTLIDYIRTNFL